jgi:hypothetical protein
MPIMMVMGAAVTGEVVTGEVVMVEAGGIVNIIMVAATSHRGVIMRHRRLLSITSPRLHVIINSRQCVIISNRLCSITRNRSGIGKTVYGCRGKWACKIIARLLTSGQLWCKIKFDNPHFPA